MPSERGYDARLFGLFFKFGLSVDSVQSDGPGGFSHTFFQRSQECTGCGACCKNNYQQTWYWFEFEKKPRVHLSEELLRLTIFDPTGSGIDVDIPIWVHHNKAGLERCDFLGTPASENYCQLHTTGEKPFHCLMAPQIGAYHVGDSYWLSKRLPSRNWRHPKCPIVMADTPPPNQAEQEMDMEILRRLNQALGHLPGCILPELIEFVPRLYDMKEFYRVSGGDSLLPFQRIINYYNNYVEPLPGEIRW